MQHTLQKIILILFSVLLFSGAVSTDTAPQTADSDPVPDLQLLQTIQALEQKATQETKIIQALNERIKQLELKVAAINSIVAEQHASEQVNRESLSPGIAQQTPHETLPIIGSAAIIQNGNAVSENQFIIENWLDFISPHLILASAGILAILLLVLIIRFYKRKHSEQLLYDEKKDGVTAFPGNQGSLHTIEKNALVAQKLAALRTAVEKGKQRRHQKD